LTLENLLKLIEIYPREIIKEDIVDGSYLGLPNMYNQSIDELIIDMMINPTYGIETCKCSIGEI